MAEEKDLLSPSFKRAFEQMNHFHDWYLKDLYIANTGKTLLEASRRGYTTVQLEFCTSNNDISYVLIYKNVTNIKISMKKQSEEDVSDLCFTSFGRCYTYKIKCDATQATHEIKFEGDARISIVAEKVKCKKIIDNFWAVWDLKQKNKGLS